MIISCGPLWRKAGLGQHHEHQLNPGSADPHDAGPGFKWKGPQLMLMMPWFQVEGPAADAHDAGLRPALRQGPAADAHDAGLEAGFRSKGPEDPGP